MPPLSPVAVWRRYVGAGSAVATVTLLLLPFRHVINSATVALSYLLIVIFVAIFWRSGPALMASALAMLCLNFFFLPPFHSFTIADQQNWIALTAFLITAIAVGQLSARVNRRAEEAESAKREVERLYYDLQCGLAVSGNANVVSFGRQTAPQHTR